MPESPIPIIDLNPTIGDPSKDQTPRHETAQSMSELEKYKSAIVTLFISRAAAYVNQYDQKRNTLKVPEKPESPFFPISLLGETGQTFFGMTDSFFDASDFEGPHKISGTAIEPSLTIIDDLYRELEKYQKFLKTLNIFPLGVITRIFMSFIEELDLPELQDFLKELYPDDKALAEDLIDSDFGRQGIPVALSVLTHAAILTCWFNKGSFPDRESIQKMLWNFVDDIQECIEEYKQYRAKCTPEYVARLKSEELPQPSPELKYVIQIPVLDEVPDEVTPKDFRGNICEFLSSLVTALRRYKEERGEDAPGKVEVLLNVNNNPGVIHAEKGKDYLGSKKNRYLLIFLDLVKDEDLDVEQVVARIPWLADATINQTIKNYYIGLIQSLRELFAEGLQVNALDCTDGTFISNPGNGALYDEPNQAIRCALITKVARDRMAMVKGSEGLVHIFTGADTRFGANYFVELDRIHNRRSKGKKIVSLQPIRVVPQRHIQLSADQQQDMGYSQELMENLTKEYYAYFLHQDFEAALWTIQERKDEIQGFPLLKRLRSLMLGQPKRSFRFTPFMSAMTVSQEAFEAHGDWLKNQASNRPTGADTNMKASLEGHVEYHLIDHALGSIVHRIREESFGGKLSNWVTGPHVQPSLELKNVINEHYPEFFKPLDQAEVTDFGFAAYFFWKKIALLPSLTKQERTLLADFIDLESGKLITLNNFAVWIRGNEGLAVESLSALILFLRRVGLADDVWNYRNIVTFVSEFTSQIDEQYRLAYDRDQDYFSQRSTIGWRMVESK